MGKKNSLVLFAIFFLLVNAAWSQYPVYQQNNLYQQNNIIIAPPPPVRLPKYTPPPPTSYTPSQDIVIPKPEYRSNEDIFKGLKPYDPLEMYMPTIVKKPRYYAKSDMNLRTYGSTEAPIIAKVETSDYVFVVNEAVGGDLYYYPTPGWWYVYHVSSKKMGWLKSSLLLPDPVK